MTRAAATKIAKKRVAKVPHETPAVEAGGKKYVAAGASPIVIDAKFLLKST